MKLNIISLTLGLSLIWHASNTLAGSVGPYYATPSWDLTLPTRYIQLSNFNNAAYLDRNTGLVWSVPDDINLPPRWRTDHMVSQEDAAYICTTSLYGGQGGWRLPSISELSSLIEVEDTQNTYDTIHHTHINLPPLGLGGLGFELPGYNRPVIWSSTFLSDSHTAVYILTVGNPNGSIRDHVVVGTLQQGNAPSTIVCVRGG